LNLSGDQKASPNAIERPEGFNKRRARQPWLTSPVTSTYIDGVSEATELAGAASSKDPAVGLWSVAALRELLERLEALQVENAREHGWSWEQIAGSLGVSKQAVHKKHASRWLRKGR
jgi:DNA-directed RNA polymerase specialized sigma24 family protein